MSSSAAALSVPRSSTPVGDEIHNPGRAVDFRCPKPAYQLGPLDKPLLEQIRSELLAQAEVLEGEFASFHWSSSEEGARTIVTEGTAPGLARGKGEGYAGRGFYAAMPEQGEDVPAPSGEANGSEESPRAIRILHGSARLAAGPVRILNGNHAGLHRWAVACGLAEQFHEQDDVMDAVRALDHLQDGDFVSQALPLVFVMPRPAGPPAHSHQPRPGDWLVFKFPLKDGENGCRMELLPPGD